MDTMSDAAGTEASTEIDGYESLEAWATEAVRGANNWLVTFRNAEDEGFDPWSDYFTSHPEKSGGEQNTGIMSYSEGLTSLGLTKAFAKETDGWRELQEDIYRKDLRIIIDTILPENGENEGLQDQPDYRLAEYSPEPYLKGELTSDFTDTVSFSTSALVEALKADLDLTKGSITEAEVERALSTNLDWFLNNAVETETGVGWAWVGSDTEKDPTPINYFTYSAVIPLCDLLASADEDIIDDVVAGREEEITDTLVGAKEFLLNEHWVEQRDSWDRPGGTGERELSTCYAIMALSYIKEFVDEVEFDDADAEKITKGMNSVVYEMNISLESIWKKKTTYQCPNDQNQYIDGTGPYLILDTITEYLRFLIDDVGELPEFDRDTVEGLRDELAHSVLDKCWAGDQEFPSKGFRHLGNTDNVGGDPKSNPTVLYTTQVGIETFLLNILEGNIESTASSSPVGGMTQSSGKGTKSTETPIEEATGGSQQIHNQYNFNFTVNDRSGDGAGPQVESFLEDIRTQLESLPSEDERGANDEIDELIEEVERLNKKFLQQDEDYRGKLGNTTSRYTEVARKSITETYKNRMEDSGNVRAGCSKRTIETFQKLFFENDPDAFRGEIEETLDTMGSELLRPWIEQFRRLHDLTDTEIVDPVTRKSEIIDGIETLIEIDPEEISDEELEEMISHIGSPEAKE